MAAVMVDGGRGQLRDERWGQPRVPGEEKPRWWRESKVSIVVTFCSQPHAADPMPNVPENLLDPLWLIPKINEMKAAKGGESAAQQIGGSPYQQVPNRLMISWMRQGRATRNEHIGPPSRWFARSWARSNPTTSWAA